MKNFRNYNIALLSSVISVLMLLVYASWHVQPYSGDLTRLGGYPESDYGWNEVMLGFEEPAFGFYYDAVHYDRHYDVVVLGDSFSQDFRYGWQNFFTNETSLSIISFHVDHVGVKDIVESQVFKESPPVAVIYESVERMAITRLSRDHLLSDELSYDRQAISKPSVVVNSSNNKLVSYHRETEDSLLNRMNVSSNMYPKKITRDWLGINTTKVQALSLDDEWFSSVKGDEILFLKSHLSTETLGLAKMDLARKGQGILSSAVESNGYSSFYLMVFPNKISIYRDRLSNYDLPVVSLVDYFDKFEQESLVRLDKPFYRALDTGEVDLYLSNDTHTSYKGYKMAADALISQMIADGVLVTQASD